MACVSWLLNSSSSRRYTYVLEIRMHFERSDTETKSNERATYYGALQLCTANIESYSK